MANRTAAVVLMVVHVITAIHDVCCLCKKSEKNLNVRKMINGIPLNTLVDAGHLLIASQILIEDGFPL